MYSKAYAIVKAVEGVDCMRQGVARALRTLLIVPIVLALFVPANAAALASGDVGVWQTDATFPVTIYGHTMVTYNNRIYVMGGNSGGPTVNVRYTNLNADGSVGSWQNGTALPAAFMSAAATLHNGYVYVMGGDPSGGAALSGAYYSKLNADGTMGAWQTGTALPVAMRLAKAVSYNGYIYVLGGDIVSASVDTVYYAPLNADGSIGTWQTTTALPAVRAAGTAIVNNGYVYFMGGYNSSGVTQTNSYYAPLNVDGTVGAWQTGTSLPYATYDANASMHNGRLYVTGGSPSGTHAEVSYMPLAANGSMAAWQTATNSIPQSLFQSESVTANGYLYVIGGSTFSGGPVTLATHYALITSVSEASLTNPVTGGAVAVSIPTSADITCSSGVAESSLGAQDGSYDYPLGLVNLCLDTDLADNQVSMTFITSLSPSQVVARNYNAGTNTYTDISGATITATTLSGQPALQLSYTLADNGSLDSNTASGHITDPVGLGVSTATTPPTVQAPATGFGMPNNNGMLAVLTSSLAVAAIALGLGLLRTRDENNEELQ